MIEKPSLRGGFLCAVVMHMLRAGRDEKAAVIEIAALSLAKHPEMRYDNRVKPLEGKTERNTYAKND